MEKTVKMWVCVANGIVDASSLAYTRKMSVQREVDRARSQIQPDLEWEDVKSWGYKCVKVNVKIELA
jgi:hypothetical protein